MNDEKPNIVWMWLESLSWEFAGGMLAILGIYCAIGGSLLLIAYWLEDRKKGRKENDN